MRIQFVRKSGNDKTGPIPTTTTERASCPPSCPLKGPKGPCYAESGYYTRTNWDHVDSGKRDHGWRAVMDQITNLPDGQLWRHNVAGDLPHTDGFIDYNLLKSLVAANTGKRGFTYTHHDLSIGSNFTLISSAIRAGFTINVSHNSPQEALAADHGLPKVTLVPLDFWATNGKREGSIVRCPAEYMDDVSCATCGLCQRADRKDIIGFTAHGSQAKAANIIARG